MHQPLCILKQTRKCIQRRALGPNLGGGSVQAQAEYLRYTEMFTAEKRELEELLAERDAAYMSLLQVPT